MTIYDPRNETMNRDLLGQFQLERLQALLARLRRSVRRYRERLGDIRVESLKDISKLPFTSAREDLLDAFPYGMFALPLREVIRLQSSAGPGGRRIILGQSANDLDYWGRLAARQLAAASVTSHDIVHMSFGESLIGHAYGCMLGAERIEATIMPEDTRHTEYQLETLRNCRATVLITTPTHAGDLIDLLRSEREDPQSLQLRTVILTRPVSAERREEIENGLFARVSCDFGIQEIMDPGFCVECEHRNLHVNEDYFLVEEDQGELIVTTLRQEATPLLRYRTGTRCTLERRSCKCGRTGVILIPGGRLDDRFYVNEISVYPQQIAHVLEKTSAAGLPYRFEQSDRALLLFIEMSQSFFADRMSALQNPCAEIRAEFMARLGIPVTVTFTDPGSCSK